MKKSVIVVLFLALTLQAQAKKRYKQRNHKIQTGGHLMIPQFEGNVNVGYAKNWGYFELGGELGLNPEGLDIKRLGPEVGLIFEGNFIKNKRKNDWVPGLGLKLAYMMDGDHIINVNPYAILKWFISYRTSINFILDYPTQVFPRRNFWSGVNLKWAFAYYFH